MKPVHQATHWINSFVLVEGKDKLGKLRLRTYLDPTYLNKAIVCEPYHFKTLEDNSHLLAEACVITVCVCRKGFWHQQLDEVSSFLTTFNTELGRFHYIVIPLGATVLGDVFQCKLDKYFGKIQQVIIIADDIIIAGYKPDQRSHDQAFTTLLQTTKKCNVWACRTNQRTFQERSKPLCRQMLATKVLVHVCYKILNQCILQARLSPMPRKVMLWLNWNLLQWLGQ